MVLCQLLVIGLPLNERGGEGHVYGKSPKTMQHMDINDLYLKSFTVTGITQKYGLLSASHLKYFQD